MNNDLFNPYEGLLRGNLFKNLYKPYINNIIEINPLNEQAKMLTEIDSLTFTLIDLNLYLDIYPNDNKIIELYNKYNDQLNNLIKLYENKYGPLSLNSDSLNSYPWAWNKMPWPWN